MSLIELSFRNENVFMTKNDIIGLTLEATQKASLV